MSEMDFDELFGLDDYEELRLSSNGQDPDRMLLRVNVRVCFKRLDDNGEVVAKDNAAILADYAARATYDRAMWRRFIGVVK